MSSIQVWTSDGNWSKKVDGCDKIHLMKEAIRTECQIAYKRCKGESLDCRDMIEAELKYKDGTITHETIHMSGLQVDNKLIDVKSLMDWEWNIDFEGIGLSNASFFKMHLSTLYTMAEEETTMSAVYNKLIECAKVPEKAPENFFLFFMFSDE